MQNFWTKTMTKADFLSNSQNNETLSEDQYNEIADNITDPVNFYMVFEDGYMRCYLTYDGTNSVMTTEIEASTTSNEANTVFTHNVIGINNDIEVGSAVFVEDYINHTLTNNSVPISGFTFSAALLTVTVVYPTGGSYPPMALWICCSACAIVHDQLGIPFLNYICCGGNCGSWGPWA